jgi:hypothetical protein
MNNHGHLVLFTSYFGPVHYFTRFLLGKKISIDVYDNYHKQSYRNRFTIMAANGILSLSIPVKKVNGTKTKTRDICIDYDTSWQKNHLRAITSAYRSAPFFEYYFDDYEPVFNRQYKYLVDLNMDILALNLDHCGIKADYEVSQSFIPLQDNDHRELIHPKVDYRRDPSFKPLPYPQVFSERHGFQANLSILDLIFNMGPETLEYLKNSIRHAPTQG